MTLVLLSPLLQSERRDTTREAEVGRRRRVAVKLTRRVNTRSTVATASQAGTRSIERKIRKRSQAVDLVSDVLRLTCFNYNHRR